MQAERQQLSGQQWWMAIALLVWLTLVGGLPMGLLAWLFYGGDVGREVGLLTGTLVATWLPLKLIVDRFVKGTGGVGAIAGLLPPFSFPALSIMGVISLVLVPVLWIFIAPAFLAGVFAYAALGQILMAGLLVGLIVQLGLIYRNAAVEKERGLDSTFFVRVESMQSQFNLNTITLPDNNVVIEQSITNDYPTVVKDEDDPPTTIVQSPQQQSSDS